MGRHIATGLAPDIVCPGCHRKDMRWVETRTAAFCSNCNRIYRVEEGGLTRVSGYPASLMRVLRSIRDMNSLH